jgi:predicted dehydrogenase
MTEFGWGLIGPGRIAHKFAEAVQGLDGMHLAAVQGRDLGRSSAFAKKWTLNRARIEAVRDVAALVADPRVHGVYIATPHAFHASAIRQCLGAGKPVFCEKPLVPNHAQGLEVVTLARERNVFLMEAVWTRFLPVYGVVKRWLREGAIGQVRAIQSSFCFNLPYDPKSRAFDPAQAGGALLDIGIYNLTMTRWALAQAFGKCPPLKALDARGVIGPGGVDHRIAATLEFPQGLVAQFVCGFEMSSDNSFRILGERGSIVVPQLFWQGTEAQLRIPGKDVAAVSRPFRINGFEDEIEEAVAVIRRGGIESPEIPHAETLATLEWMDRIRTVVGVRYPFE